jgi:acyl-homoserine-lactone acylase
VFNAIDATFEPGVGYDDITHGSSFVMVTSFEGGCPKDRSILTYSLSDNPASEHYADQTRMFSRKEWVNPPFCPGQVKRAAESVDVVRAK